MSFGGVIKVQYWAIQEGDTALLELDGIDEFKNALETNYICHIHARPGDLGGNYGLAVEFLTTLSLQHFLALVLDGIAYDLIKSGSHALVLRPFLKAYEALRKRNDDKHLGVHIEQITLMFEDSIVLIHEIGNELLTKNIGKVIHTLAKNYSDMALRTGEKPFCIRVPIFEDPAVDRLSRFRELLEVDETIEDRTDEDYLRLWGLEYDYARTTRVFDVKEHLLLDQEFCTRAGYWQLWELRRTREGE